MGVVYRATDTKLQRDVALKLLPDELTADPSRRNRFQREAQLLAALNHPHIASVYGIEENAIVMELVEGPTLADRIAGGAIPEPEAIAIARQIAEALEAAHEKGIIHRDLKPANIMVTEEPDGRRTVRILDFGIAKLLLPQAGEDGTLTGGVLIGTPMYMSPEQAQGEAVDARADVYSLGVILYQAVTGRRPFSGKRALELLREILRDPVPPFSVCGIPDEPRGLESVLMKAMAKSAAKRFASAEEMRRQMATLLEGDSMPTLEPDPPRRKGAPRRESAASPPTLPSPTTAPIPVVAPVSVPDLTAGQLTTAELPPPDFAVVREIVRASRAGSDSACGEESASDPGRKPDAEGEANRPSVRSGEAEPGRIRPFALPPGAPSAPARDAAGPPAAASPVPSDPVAASPVPGNPAAVATVAPAESEPDESGARDPAAAAGSVSPQGEAVDSGVKDESAPSSVEGTYPLWIIERDGWPVMKDEREDRTESVEALPTRGGAPPRGASLANPAWTPPGPNDGHISFACVCGRRIVVRDVHAGRGGACPRCWRHVQVPRPVRRRPREIAYFSRCAHCREPVEADSEAPLQSLCCVGCMKLVSVRPR